MKVIKKKIEELTEDPNNVRMHDGRNVEAIRKSLQEFGQQKPIIINEYGGVVAGNGTLQAAIELGWKDIRAVITNLSDINQTGFAIADNRTAELSGWDNELLANAMSGLGDDGLDLEALGFNQIEMDNLLSTLPDLNVSPSPTTDSVGGYTRTKEDYEASTIRSLHFFYDQEQYVKIVNALDAEKNKRKLNTYTEVMVEMLTEAGHEV